MTDNLWVQESWINATKGWRIGDSDVYESYCTSKGELYRDLCKEYGRCIGRVYIDEGKPIGWVFQKRQTYDDCVETYLLETWVTVHSGPPDRSITYHYV